MNEFQAKEALCEIGRRIWQRNYVASNDGNLSYRIDDSRIVSTPTMISKGFMQPSDMCIVNIDGEQIAGERKVTSEIKLHLQIYRHRPEIKSVVHAHPPHATAFAIAGKPVPKCVLPEVEVNLGQIPTAPYATPGSKEVETVIEPCIKDHFGFLLRNHGAVTLGKDPFEAYYRMETLDQYCYILILAASIGGWEKLDFNSMKELFKLKERLGIPDTRANFNCYDDICNPEKKAAGKIEEPAETAASPKDVIEKVVRDILKQKGLIK